MGPPTKRVGLIVSKRANGDPSLGHSGAAARAAFRVRSIVGRQFLPHDSCPIPHCRRRQHNRYGVKTITRSLSEDFSELATD
jgi:hypothetical protein